MANSDQVFLPIDIFPLQDLVLDVFPEPIHSGEAHPGSDLSPLSQKGETVRSLIKLLYLLFVTVQATAPLVLFTAESLKGISERQIL